MNFFDLLKEHKFVAINIIIVIVNIIIIYIGNYVLLNNRESEYSEITYIEKDDNDELSDDSNYQINVEIKGAVKSPGVYKLTNNAIVNDLIQSAGGVKSNAYTNNINLSKKLNDETVIYVYTTKEYQNLKKSVDEAKKEELLVDKCECSTYDVSKCIENGVSEIVVGTNDTFSNENSVEQKLININSASKDELVSLPGLGESKADAIIKYRNEHGIFNSIDEIINVSGIGNSLYEKIKAYITV